MKSFFTYLLNSVKRYLSISFVGMLLVSTLLWGGVKLGHTYTTRVGFIVLVNDKTASCEAMVEGTGFQILKFKSVAKNGITVERSEVKLRRINTDSLAIESNSLQGVLASRYDNVKFISVASTGGLQ